MDRRWIVKRPYGPSILWDLGMAGDPIDRFGPYDRLDRFVFDASEPLVPSFGGKYLLRPSPFGVEPEPYSD